jgi:aryl-alcohol dehydrogenase-like predicted oxidoreductase
MEYSALGDTNLVVSRFTLGSGNRFSQAHDSSQFSENAERIIEKALDSGINAVDTRDMDKFGVLEEILGRAIRPRRHELVVSAKIGSRIARDASERGSSYGHVISSAEAGLRILGTDYYDILLIHLDDVFTRIDENIRAVENLVFRGLARYAGFYNFSVWRTSEGFSKRGNTGYGRFIAAQMQYSLLDRGIEYDVAPLLGDEGIGLQVRNPFSGGVSAKGFAGFTEPANSSAVRHFNTNHANTEIRTGILDTLTAIGRRYGNATPATIALGWLLAKPFVSTVILGIASTDQLEEHLGAFELSLSQEDVGLLDALSEPKSFFPGWMNEERRSLRIQTAL